MLGFWEMTSAMFPYSTFSLVRFWIHAQASVLLVMVHFALFSSVVGRPAGMSASLSVWTSLSACS